MLLHELLSIPCAICPDRTAIVSHEQALSFAGLWQRSAALAAELRERGLGVGARVAVLDVNSPLHVTTCFAASMLGGIYVPLNFRLRVEELAEQLEATGPACLLAGKRYLELAAAAGRAAGVEVLAPDAPGSDPPATDVDPAVLDPDAPATLVFTAGTTGRPRAVVLSHRSFSAYALENVTPADPQRLGEVVLQVMPLHHVAGIQGLLAAVYAGRTQILEPQFEARRWVEAVERHRVTHSVLVPTMLKQVLDQPDLAARDLSSLQQITYGAATMPLPVIERALKVFPHVRFINAFGQTETASTITALGPEDHRLAEDPATRATQLRRLAASVGKPLPGVEIAVVDENGQALPAGEVGHIVARGDRMMAGYWNQPEATQERFRAGWLDTGDLGWLDEDGYLYLAGRARDIIKRGGELIVPDEIERVLREHPAVDDAAVVGLADLEWGERIAAAVVLRPGALATAEELVAHCRSRLAGYKKPETISFMPALPRNALGKVLKDALRFSLASDSDRPRARDPDACVP